MSDVDGSRSGTPAGTGGAAPNFTERELQILSCAWRCLKSGPPEIDNQKLAGMCGMSNPRSAGNAWAKIKTKLMADVPEGGAAFTPKKGRKAAPKPDAGEADSGDAAATPKKTPRKRAAKSQEVDGEEATPKKRGRPAKKAVEVKAEDDGGSDKERDLALEAMDEDDALDEV